jgi:hypothetical protein
MLSCSLFVFSSFKLVMDCLNYIFILLQTYKLYLVYLYPGLYKKVLLYVLLTGATGSKGVMKTVNYCISFDIGYLLIFNAKIQVDTNNKTSTNPCGALSNAAEQLIGE